MEKSPPNLRKLYESDLLTVLKRFQKRKKWVLLAAMFVRLYYIFFMAGVLSLMIGFLQIFPFNEFDFAKGFMIFIKGFFYLVLGIVILFLSKQYITLPLKTRYPQLNKKQLLLNLIQVSGAVLIATIAYFAGTYYLGGKPDITLFLKFASVILPLFIFLVPVKILEKKEYNFDNNFKQEILPVLLNFIDPEISYNTFSALSKSTYENAELFESSNIYSFSGSDKTAGLQGQTSFEMSFLEVMTKEEYKSGSEKKVEIKEAFKGILYVSDFNKNFSGKTFIRPDSMRKGLGLVLGEMANKALALGSKQLVTLENPLFEKEFVVLSTDPIEARYILSPLMMERMLELKMHFNAEMMFSFTGNKMYIALPSVKNIFNPNLFSDLARFELIEKYYFQFKNFLAITEILKQNTRIWGN